MRCVVWWGAERDISKGEQLLHTYGDLSEAQLLQTYGFVEAFQPGYENPHNFVPIPVQLVLQSCSESGDEVSLLSLPCNLVLRQQQLRAFKAQQGDVHWKHHRCVAEEAADCRLCAHMLRSIARMFILDTTVSSPSYTGLHLRNFQNRKRVHSSGAPSSHTTALPSTFAHTVCAYML